MNCDLKVNGIKMNNELFNLKINQFIDVINDLQCKDFLDGEILIVQEDQVLLHEFSQDVGCFKDPKFMIGSVSKQFFSVALLKALYDCSPSTIEKGKISDVKTGLDASISTYLPDESAIWSGNMPEWAYKISLHHLLTHTSGIPNFTGLNEYSAETDLGRKFFEFNRSSAEIIRLVLNKELQFNPGTKFSYSNTGYLIIAEIIEAITKKTASSYIQESLLDPIGLSSTTNVERGRWDELILDKKYAELVPQWKYDPTGHIDRLYSLIHSEDLSIAKGGGSIISTACDLLKWNQALHKKRLILSDQLYDIFINESLDENEKEIVYGYGIRIDKSCLGTVLAHDGGIGAYRTFLGYCPDYDLSIIFLSHISYDYGKIEEEFKTLLLNLQQMIPHEEERTQEALKILSKKYPNTRGFEKIMDTLRKLLINNVSDHD